jgi:hypothetical protein
MGSFAVTYDTLTDSDLDCQVESTKRCGMRMSHQLTGKKEINEDRYSKVSDAVTRDGYISLTNPGHAYKVLERLRKKVDFVKSGKFTLQVYKDPQHLDPRDGDVIITDSKAAGSTSPLVIGRGVMRDRIVFGFAPQFNIHHSDLAIRRNHLLALRKCIWHEIMETALLAINIEGFNSTNPNIWGAGNFADLAVGGIARVNENSHDHRFFPWTGDKIPSPSHLAGKTAVSLPQKPVKEITMSSASGISGYITDYANRNVLNIKVPAGKTLTWGSETTTNSSQYKYNAQPGSYRIKASLGKQVVDQTVEILPGSKLPTLKAEFQRDRFGELYIIIEYANWIRDKRLEIRVAKINANSGVEFFKPDKKQDKITWGKGYDFHREGYKVEAYVNGNGDRFLADLLNKGELVKPKEVKLYFRSHWRAQMGNASRYVRISYEVWHGYFICKILDFATNKKVAEFTKTDSYGYIEWGQNQKPGKYIIEVTIDKGIVERQTIEISQ